MKLNKLGPQKATAQRFSTMPVIGCKPQITRTPYAYQNFS